MTGLLEQFELPAVVLDDDGVIVWQNEAAIAVRGARIGAHVVEFVALTEQAEARDVLTRILCYGEPAELTLQIRHPDGSYVPVELSAVPIAGLGTVVAVFGLKRAVAPIPERP